MENNIFPLRVSASSGVSVAGTFLLLKSYTGEILVAGYYDRAKSKVRSVACCFGTGVISNGYKRYYTKGMEYGTVYKPVNTGRDRFTYAITYSKAINDGLILTTKEDEMEDIYQYLMNHFKTPLLREFVPYIVEQAITDRFMERPYLRTVKAYDGVTIPLKGKDVPIDTIQAVSFYGMTEKVLQEILSEGLKLGKIRITDKEMNPLKLDNFDEYIRNYGSSIVSNLEEELTPLSPLKGKVDAAAFFHKRMYPQQGACVNGLIALIKSGAKYGFAAEGMGCGKTLQGAAVCDTYFNEKWLKQNPGKTLKDLYTAKEVSYRNILMAPSHLIAKWKEELESELPDVKVTIIKDFTQLVGIKDRGVKRNGREWYLIAKDFCKLGSQLAPIPTQVAVKYPVLKYCADCYNDSNKLVPLMTNKSTKRCACPDCGGRKVLRRENTYYGKFRGMTCPECGELLIEANPHWYDGGLENPYEKVLTPKDFASKTSANATCFVCGAQLWGADCKPVDHTGQMFMGVNTVKPKWYKVSHFKNAAKKSRATAFVLRFHEDDYKRNNYCSDYKTLGREYGPRKTAPAMFIKKHLKGFFDFCVLDECHKYENGGTAQTVAAHALIKSSKFTLGLTGTLTNGKADSLFYLLYLLDPRKMQQAGYAYTDCMSFCQKYGAVETCYEVDDNRRGYNKGSRGRQIGSPKVKPGISPLLVTDFLLERSVFLDLSDLSKYLPQLKEEVVLVPTPDDVKDGYDSVIDKLKEVAKNGEGLGALSKMLTFGLSYPDKPFGRKDILSTKKEDEVLAYVPNIDRFETELLPKEEKLIELVNKEIEENRNCFVYCSYTGEAELNVTGRLKNLIEDKCNLKGQVLILESSSPKAEEREAYIKQKATEGYRVIICNPKCVETGLDFCFYQDGKWYNYPTLIFYQISYELSVMWQASRRAYRLIQKEECRNYYLGYEGTLQAAALEVMAEKQVAASAIQGKFSAEGLSALAKGVDPRLKLAQMLSSGDMSNRKSLENMFDALNQSYEADDSVYGEYEQPQTYYELMGIGELTDEQVEEAIDTEVVTVTETTSTEVKEEVKEAKKDETFTGTSLFDLFSDIPMTVTLNDNAVVNKGNIKAKKEKKVEGQTSLFDLLAG